MFCTCPLLLLSVLDDVLLVSLIRSNDMACRLSCLPVIGQSGWTCKPDVVGFGSALPATSHADRWYV